MRSCPNRASALLLAGMALVGLGRADQRRAAGARLARVGPSRIHRHFGAILTGARLVLHLPLQPRSSRGPRLAGGDRLRDPSRLGGDHRSDPWIAGVGSLAARIGEAPGWSRWPPAKRRPYRALLPWPQREVWVRASHARPAIPGHLPTPRPRCRRGSRPGVPAGPSQPAVR